MHAHDAIGYLRRDWKIDPIVLLPRSRQIVLVDEEWVFTELVEAARVYAREMGLERYVRESNHCPQFVMRVVSLASDLHIRGGQHSDSGIAVGEFWYQRNGHPADEHAVVTALAPAPGGRIKPVFMEPQRLWDGSGGRIESLTEAERISCTALSLS